MKEAPSKKQIEGLTKEVVKDVKNIKSYISKELLKIASTHGKIDLSIQDFNEGVSALMEPTKSEKDAQNAVISFQETKATIYKKIDKLISLGAEAEFFNELKEDLAEQEAYFREQLSTEQGIRGIVKTALKQNLLIDNLRFSEKINDEYKTVEVDKKVKLQQQIGELIDIPDELLQAFLVENKEFLERAEIAKEKYSITLDANDEKENGIRKKLDRFLTESLANNIAIEGEFGAYFNNAVISSDNLIQQDILEKTTSEISSKFNNEFLEESKAITMASSAAEKLKENNNITLSDESFEQLKDQIIPFIKNNNGDLSKEQQQLISQNIAEQIGKQDNFLSRMARKIFDVPVSNFQDTLEATNENNLLPRIARRIFNIPMSVSKKTLDRIVENTTRDLKELSERSPADSPSQENEIESPSIESPVQKQNISTEVDVKKANEGKWVKKFGSEDQNIYTEKSGEKKWADKVGGKKDQKEKSFAETELEKQANKEQESSQGVGRK